jgi:hypothetical protein
MLRILICALMLFACATSSKAVTRDVHDCVDIGPIESGPCAAIVSETETMGPARVIWAHPPEVVRGYFVESNRYLYRCPTPRPPAASSKHG